MTLLKGTVDVLVLKPLAWGPTHALAITPWPEGRPGGRLAVEDTALVRPLHRMEARGLLAAEWGVGDDDRRARDSRRTTAGRARLGAGSAKLAENVDALAAVFTTRTAAG